ncbi:MAG: cytochrome C [Desulfuromonas sp.]|nr:MAG: cytochrome C [Desulfuromonas sp.]
MFRFRVAIVTLIIFCCVGVVFAAPTQQSTPTPNLPQQNAELYATDPQPLTLEQCGQCHPQHFQGIKQMGGRHQFDCRECHTIFHAFNPRRDNYTAIMPQCSQCHVPVHGNKFTRCLACHQNPHMATKAPAVQIMVNICGECHSEQKRQLVAAPSAHTEVSCDSCHHTEHGSIPSCAECHEPHFETQEFSTCTACHDVHQPLIIAMGGDIELQTCSGCHGDIYTKWSTTASKHGQVRCNDCHDRHKQIPQCQDCHGIPDNHSAKMMARFPRCLDCHLDVHDLPVKR